MSEEEEIVVQPPPKKILGIPVMPDARHVLRKASTWLALAATAVGGYCGASLAAYALAPEEARAAITAAELAWLARGSMIAAGITALIPIATSIRQRAPK